jgi:hypothetical protein
MASATGSHPDTGSSVRPLPGSTTTIRPAAGRRFSAPKTSPLTERGFVTVHSGTVPVPSGESTSDIDNCHGGAKKVRITTLRPPECAGLYVGELLGPRTLVRRWRWIT